MTISDIASKAGFSISTVSRVLNKPETVRPETREKIEKVLRECHYTPNAFARGLVRNSMKNIVVMAHDIRQLQMSYLIYALEKEFLNWGYTTTVCNTDFDKDKMISYLQVMAEKQADGIVLLGSMFSLPEVEQTIARYLSKTPIVLSNGSMTLPNVNSVLIDHLHGMRLLVDHFIERGRSRIIFLYQFSSYNTTRKIHAFQQAMSERGLSHEKHIFDTGTTHVVFFEHIQKILSQVSDYDAVLCTDDILAMLVMQYMAKNNKKIPEDVSVSGYEDTYLAKLSTPMLTSVDTRIDAVSGVISNILRDRLADSQKYEGVSSVFVRPALNIRDST